MTKRHAAFISYAHHYQDWVTALQRNLEACLRAAAHEPSEVFLDRTDLASGRSWIAQLQEGVAQAEHLILIATPEALASPRVEDEWEGFIARQRDWARGRFHVVWLVDAPLPPFLDRIERLDFVDHDDERYREELRRLAGGILGREARDLPKLPDAIEIPSPPVDVLAKDCGVGSSPGLRP